jgi:nitrile hydratase subunit beta
VPRLCFDVSVDGAHDLGGRQGFGPVQVELDEPVFHEPWERRVFGLNAAISVQGMGTMGEARHSSERMDPVHYLSSPYYEHWLTGLATRLVERGIVTAAELDERAGGPFPLARPVAVEPLAEPGPSRVEPAFAVGDRARVRDVRFSGHTRCPDYVGGREGTVIRVDGAFSLPDVEAHCDEKRIEPAYSVRFDAATLWGDEGGAGESVCVDLWESYLEAP